MTDIRLDLVYRIPATVAYDREHDEFTAFNDDVRVAAVGRTRDEAMDHFRLAVGALLPDFEGHADYVSSRRRRDLVLV